jgi:YesN/AraC family two-component response regulator
MCFKTILILLFSVSVYTQELSNIELLSLEDEGLLEYFETVRHDSLKASFVASIYLQRGKQRADTIMMARGFDRLAQSYSPYTNIKYTDSVIALTLKSKHITYPAFGYILKAYNYDKLDQFKRANKYSYIAYDHALDAGNLSQQLYILEAFIFNKVVWGNKKEALALQQKRHQLLMSKVYLKKLYLATRKGARDSIDGYYNKQKTDSYLSFAICHHYLGQRDSTQYYLDIAKDLIDNNMPNNIYAMKSKYYEINMEHFYFKKDYTTSLKYNDSLVSLNSRLNSNFKNVYFFKGLSFFDIGNSVAGLKFLKKADSIFDTGDRINIQPQDNLLFEKLKSHYSSLGDYKNQIKYLNKQLLLDSLLTIKTLGLESDLIRKIEIPTLLKEKQEIELKLSTQTIKSKKAITYIVLIFGIFTTVLMFYIHKQQTYKKRYRQLIRKQQDKVEASSQTQQSNFTISEVIVQDILERLEAFEKQKKYLTTNVSLQSLSKDLQTNPNYLSRVINFNRDKNFSQYLNDLRIGYALNALKVNPTFLRYSIKAIAFECGYTNATSFSRAFYKQTGLYPSFYIKQLSKKKK